MANFSPSINLPNAGLPRLLKARTVIYQELDDIINLLDNELLVKDFCFRHADFNAAITQEMHKNSNTQTNRLIHTIETISLKDDDEVKVIQSPNFDELEARLTHNLSVQIDEFWVSIWLSFLKICVPGLKWRYGMSWQIISPKKNYLKTNLLQ